MIITGMISRDESPPPLLAT